jgi:FAD-linked oxidoreductase
MVSRRTVVAGAVGAGLAVAGGAAGYRAWRDREPTSPPAQDGDGRLLWRNWSGIQNAYPKERVAPDSEGALVDAMKSSPGPIRPVGAGHSFTALVPTEGTLLSLDRMSGLVNHDAAKLQATVRAGTRLGDLGPALAAIGQEMPNLPDINKQSLGGALGTGTHGTGRGFKAIHGEVTALRIATSRGDVIACDRTTNADIFHATRVNLGAFGVISEVTLQNRPLKRVLKRTVVRQLDEVIEEWPTLIARHRNVEFYAIPFTGLAALITVDETDRPVSPRGPDTDADAVMELKKLRDVAGFLPSVRRSLAQSAFRDAQPEEAVDEGWKLLSNERPVRFNEMEFHLPLDVQMKALREVIAAIEKHRADVFFPIEARVIDADDAWLSPFHDRVSGSIAVHAYYKDDYSFLFDLVEPILRKHGGRPHWGKLHSLKNADFMSLYPRFKDAAAVREMLDPAGRMLNDHLRAVFYNG